jgi:hypothetical protein
MLNLDNLDARTRTRMMLELRRDVSADRVYVSPRLSPAGKSVYVNLLRDAIESGSAESFAMAMNSPRYFNSTEPRETANGEIEARVPESAAQTLGEGEFNRYYCRGLCIRAIEDGIDGLIVYRAKAVQTPRSESLRRIGSTIDPTSLLSDLRAHVETLLGVPGGPNSGLSVRLPTAPTRRPLPRHDPALSRSLDGSL